MSALTVVTWNVWFEDRHREERWRAILDILRRSDADVIGLQEVTPKFLEMLHRSGMGLEYRAPSELDASYDEVLLSRLPFHGFRKYGLTSRFGRSVLLATVDAGGSEITVASTHLESFRESEEVREVQLRKIENLLYPFSSAILMGDLNFCATWKENLNLDPRLRDVWAELKRVEPGWTIDSDRNTMLEKSERFKNVRFDRILLRSKEWHPVSIEMLGTEAIGDRLFPSDHFGLKARLEIAR